MIDAIPEQKYLVTRLNDGSVVEDAVVIRTSDQFAATALWGYVNTVQSVIEVLKGLGIDDVSGLVRVADYFSAKAVEADQGNKLPD